MRFNHAVSCDSLIKNHLFYVNAKERKQLSKVKNQANLSSPQLCAFVPLCLCASVPEQTFSSNLKNKPKIDTST